VSAIAVFAHVFRGAVPQRASRARNGNDEKGGSDIVSLAGVAVVDAQQGDQLTARLMKARRG